MSSSTLSPATSDPNQPFQESSIHNPLQESPKTIDITTEISKGNFLPAIHALRNKLIPRDYIDSEGFHVLHHAVCQSKIPVVLILLDHLKLDINIKSQNDQTALMIACNYGNIEIIRLLVERGAKVDTQDNTLFSPLFYSVKHGYMPQTAYLIHLKSDLSKRDASGCTLAHWAAYHNNPFFLKLLNRLGVSLKTEDHMGLTPLERAIESQSYQAVEYLLNHAYQYSSIPRSLKIEEIKQSDLKELVRRKFNPSKTEVFYDKFLKGIQARGRILIFVLYLVLWALGVDFYRKTTMHSKSVDIVLFLASIYFLGLSYFYILRTAKGECRNLKHNSLKKLVREGKERDDSTSDERTVTESDLYEQAIDFKVLDKLVLKGDAGLTISEERSKSNTFASFLHELVYLFETKNYEALESFDKRDFCADCLQRKDPKTVHPEKSTTCVKNFHHYSHLLGRSVDSSTHILYVLLLITQGIGLGLFIIGSWVYYWNKVVNVKIWAIEVGFLIDEQAGMFYHLLYWVFVILMVYNSIFLAIELYGIAFNLTYYEIFNGVSCTYLHRVKSDRKGNIFKSYYNPFDKGVRRNVTAYFRRIGK